MGMLRVCHADPNLRNKRLQNTNELSYHSNSAVVHLAVLGERGSSRSNRTHKLILAEDARKRQESVLTIFVSAVNFAWCRNTGGIGDV